MCCASCELALEGVVSKAFELRNKGPIVTPLTLGLGGCVEAFPLELLGQQFQLAPVLLPRALPCPQGARTQPVFPSGWAGSPLTRMSIDRSSHLWFYLLIKALCLGP